MTQNEIDISGTNIELLEDIDNTHPQVDGELLFKNEYMSNINSTKLSNLINNEYKKSKSHNLILNYIKTYLYKSTTSPDLPEITDKQAYLNGCYIYNELKKYLAINSLDDFMSTYPSWDTGLYININLDKFQRNKYLEFYYDYNNKIWLGHQIYYYLGNIVGITGYDRYDDLISFFRWLTYDLPKDSPFQLKGCPLKKFLPLS